MTNSGIVSLPSQLCQKWPANAIGTGHKHHPAICSVCPFTGIRANGVDAWYVLFADEGHGFLKKHNDDLRREVETLFLRQLFEGK
jgi:hypothetical protein